MFPRSVNSASPSPRTVEPARSETSIPAPEAAARAQSLSHDQAAEQRGRDWVARRTERLERFEKGRRASTAGARSASRDRSSPETLDARAAPTAHEALGGLEDSDFSAPRPADTEAWMAIRVAHERAAVFEEHAREALPGPDGAGPRRRG